MTLDRVLDREQNAVLEDVEKGRGYHNDERAAKDLEPDDEDDFDEEVVTTDPLKDVKRDVAFVFRT